MNDRAKRARRRTTLVFWQGLSRRPDANAERPKEEDERFVQELSRIKIGPKCGGGRRVIRKKIGGD